MRSNGRGTQTVCRPTTRRRAAVLVHDERAALAPAAPEAGRLAAALDTDGPSGRFLQRDGAVAW